MASFLTQIREIFAVQQLQQYSSPETVYIVASFIEFLVDSLEKSSSPSCPWVIIPSQTNVLCKRLKFMNVFLHDTPFRCIELEGSNNILADIESTANKVGIFLSSFFFTTDHISPAKMDLELSLLLSKLEVVEKKIKEHFAAVFQQPKFTTPSLTSASIYIVDSLIDDLNHLLNDKVDLIIEVKDQITTLHEELYSSRSMLRDIELPQNKDLKECEMQLIDLAYRAEYVIACFVAGEVPLWYLAFRLPSFMWECKPIRASLNKIKQHLGPICGQVPKSSSEVSSSQISIERAVDEIIVGFKETRRQIAEQLFGGLKNLQIISIIGMGGLGKTTLARNLYNHYNAHSHFDKRSWCVVSQSHEKRKLLMNILSSLLSLNKDELSNMEDHQLADRLYKSLKGLRYLLVMDDIWKKEAWDDLKRYLPDDRNGSRILFTSRNKDVTLQASFESIIHDLSLLSTDECWDLLQKKAFPNSTCPQELENVGKEIARNCKGLPLAVVGIATILAKMEKKSLWKKVATNLSSYLSRRQDILELSYEHLPSHLKPCFLYLGLFGEDEEIPIRQLLSQWVSQGFIPNNEKNTSMDVAEGYLSQLIDRSMVQVTKRRSDNRVKTCTMHDLMRDMCLRLADKENFAAMIKGESSTYEQYHHICIDDSHSSNFTSRPFRLGVRSLFCYFEDSYPITSSLKRLRVLKFSESKIVHGTIFEFLVQLRHLECDGSLSNLESHMNLEFLSIGRQSEKDIQLNMPKLRHLNLGNFSKFPLKYLHMSETYSLQTLLGIIIRNLEDEERLRCLFNLRSLKCAYGESWEGSPNFSFLSQLVSLNIRGNYRMFKAINFPIHIKKLSISSMGLHYGLLSSIGALPHLEILKFYSTRFEEWRWNTNDGEFQTLKFLKLERVILEEWKTSEDHFPVLEKLVLSGCPNLKVLPSDLGNIPTLQSIEVLHCAKAIRNSAKHIKKEQEAAGNEQFKVIISGVY